MNRMAVLIVCILAGVEDGGTDPDPATASMPFNQATPCRSARALLDLGCSPHIFITG